MIRGRRRPDLVPEPSESGWPALYRTVRESDINKVDDCREDIDTLLVFAGLYSAVLTAFVIESYTHLQEDPQDVIIGLLQQIATQNFISGPGFINSTTTPTSTPPFEPPLWAIRVNVLWFTSLLLSLSSASFGILVKQWLREYLAIDYAAPRERLRARQYRSPAMAEWKVFEIAALLPLLLQLSLGLFFIGLCFFTAAIHTSIGRTTTPLVCAWIFLLTVTTIAPLFSPRCPFKTTFLKAGLRAGRCYITPLLIHLLRLVTLPLRCMARLALQGRSYFSAGWTYIQERLFRIFDALDDVARSIPWNWAGVLFRVVCCIALSPVLLPVLAWSRPESLIRHGSRQLIGYTLLRFIERVKQPLVIWERNTREAASREEEEVIKTEEEDTKVLLSIDTLVSDDGLLPSMFDAAQQQAATTPAKFVGFIFEMINNRILRQLDTKRPSDPARAVPDLRVLPKFAWSNIAGALMKVIPRQAPSAPNENTPDWVFRVIFIILSNPQADPLDLAALGEISIVPPRMSAHSCTGGVHLHQCSPRIASTRTISTDPPNSSTTKCLLCIFDVYKMLMSLDPEYSHASLRHTLDVQPSNEFAIFAKRVMQDLYDNIIPVFLSSSSSPRPWAEIPGSHEALHIVLQHGKKFGRRDDAVELCRQMLLTEPGTRMFLVQFAALHPQCRVSEDRREVLWTAPASDEEGDRIRSHLTAACERFCNGGDDGDGDVPLDYVRLYAVFFRLMENGQAARAAAKAIEKYHRTQGWRKELQRRDYWYSDAPSPTSEELFKEDQGLACKVLKQWMMRSTELINALRLFVPEERSEEVLSSIREDIFTRYYNPPTSPAPSTVLEDSEDTQGGTAEGGQEAGDAGQEGIEGTGQDAGCGDAADAEPSGGADANAVEVQAGDEGMEDRDATEREVVEEGAAGDGGDLAGGGGAQGMAAMAGN